MESIIVGIVLIYLRECRKKYAARSFQCHVLRFSMVIYGENLIARRLL